MTNSPEAVDLDEVKALAGGSAMLALKLSALGKPITAGGVKNVAPRARRTCCACCGNYRIAALFVETGRVPGRVHPSQGERSVILGVADSAQSDLPFPAGRLCRQGRKFALPPQRDNRKQPGGCIA
jgi:hypothetical protein